MRRAGLAPVTNKTRVEWVGVLSIARSHRQEADWVGGWSRTHPVTGLPAGVKALKAFYITILPSDSVIQCLFRVVLLPAKRYRNGWL